VLYPCPGESARELVSASTTDPQFESLSKRLVPEAVNFVASSLLILLPRRKDAKNVAFPDTKAPEVDLKLASTSQAAPKEPVDLAAALGDETEQVKADLVAAALRLIQTYAAMYASHEAFIEVFKPVLTVVEGSRLPKHSDSLKVNHLPSH
jgi:nucleolar protein 14